MDNTSRVAQWRQKMKDEGKEALTVWVSRDAKLRLEDLASTWHSTTSEMIEQALAQFHPGSPPHIGNAADTAQIQALMQDMVRAILPELKEQMLQELRGDMAVADMNGNVTETLPVQQCEAEPDHSVTTEPTPPRTEGSQARAYGEVPAAVLAALAQQQSATPAEIAHALGDGSKQGTKTVWQALQRLCKNGKVVKQGKRYQRVG